MVAAGIDPGQRRMTRLLRVQLRQELQLRYVGSIAGIYWAVINPLVQVFVYVVLVTLIFHAKLAGATTGGKFDYAIFLLAGMAPWLAIQDGLLNGSTSLIRHSSIVRNVVFPLELLPTTAVVASIAPLTVGLITLGVFLAISPSHTVGASLVTLPLLFAVQMLFTFGFALVLSVVTVFVRDLQFILPVLFQVVLLVTPILYLPANVPHWLAEIMRVNPLTYIVMGYRDVLYSDAWPSALGLAYSTVFSLALVAFGLLVFRRLKGYAEALV
jgi:homopolymeric O-antigen transport system permease protein